MKIISLDTETTGLDFYHGAKPFFVTICGEDGKPEYWEWPVDPLTRGPIIPPHDLLDIQDVIDHADLIVMQNGKFDIQALLTVLPDLDFPYPKVRDTLLTAHVLESMLDKGLDDLAVRWVGEDINPLEDRMEEAVKECRRLVQQAQLRVRRGKEGEDSLALWRIAAEGQEDMPSAGGDLWKADSWLPRAMADHLNHPADHPYRTVTVQYACKDSEITLGIWLLMEQELKKRDLWAEYLERLKIIPFNVNMEVRGVTCVASNFARMKEEYRAEVDRLEDRCLAIAASCGVTLDMPKGNRNDSLEAFCFTDPKGLRLPVLKKTDSGKPSLDKYVMEDLENSLPPNSKGHLFVKALRRKGSRATALSYINAYERFWLPLDSLGENQTRTGGNPGASDAKAPTGYQPTAPCFPPERPSPTHYVLHPNLKPTGTKTTRWSSSNPNEQNISKRGIEVTCVACRGIGKGDDGEDCKTCWDRDEQVSTGKVPLSLRYGFGPAPGREWWSMDAKNLELRIPAYEAGEQEMIALFEEPDKPPYKGSNHMLNFHTIYPDLWEAAVKEVGVEKVAGYVKKKYADSWYQWCKNGGFAVLYGAVDREDGYGTADLAFRKKGAHSLLKARFANMEALNQYWIRFANKNGYVETMPRAQVNPRRGYPLMVGRTKWSKVKPTQPLNYHVQGTACLWMQDAMIACHAQFEEWRREKQSHNEPYDGFITMQIHDEIVFDLPRRADPSKDPKRSNLGRIRTLQKCMEQGGINIGVPTPTSCEFHTNNWAEGVTF